MSTRAHARSRRSKAPAPPRTFTAATGLTGATPEELAHRAEITAAAMAAAQRSDARAAKLAKLVKQVVPSPSMDSARPAGALPAASSKARSTESAMEPAGRPRSEPKALMPHKVRTVPTRAEASPSPSPSPAPASETRSGPNPTGAKGTKGLGIALPWAVRSGTDRPPRVFKLPEAGTPSGGESEGSADDHVGPVIGLADGVTIAEALRSDGPSRSATSTAAESKDNTPSHQGDKTAAQKKGLRAPRGGGRWHRGPNSTRDESRRRPVSPTPSSTSTSKETSGGVRSSLPFVRHKGSAAKESGQTSRRKLLWRKSGQAPSNKKKAESKRARKKEAKKKTPTTPLERRRRIPVALAGVFALAILATNFPLSSILGQHHQLAAASAQLSKVRQQNKALTEQEKALRSNVAINELARGDLQMVSPGQTLYDVLPPSSKTDTTTPGAPTSGDPGSQPLVAPNNAPDLSPQQVLPTPIPASAAGSSAPASGKSAAATEVSNSTAPAPTPSSYWGRVADTLEFWR